MSIEAMRYALAALEWNLPVIEDYGHKEQLKRQRKAITAIKQALKQPVQEPVAWCTKNDLENMAKGFSQDVPARSMRVPQLYPEGNTVLLYTTPPAAPQTWTGLTDEEMDAALRKAGVVATFEALRCIGREVEAKLKQKNTDWFAPMEQITDPCPGCTPGHVCRTPACGRLQLPQNHPLRNTQ